MMVPNASEPHCTGLLGGCGFKSVFRAPSKAVTRASAAGAAAASLTALALPPAVLPHCMLSPSAARPRAGVRLALGAMLVDACVISCSASILLPLPSAGGVSDATAAFALWPPAEGGWLPCKRQRCCATLVATPVVLSSSTCGSLCLSVKPYQRRMTSGPCSQTKRCHTCATPSCVYARGLWIVFHRALPVTPAPTFIEQVQ